MLTDVQIQNKMESPNRFFLDLDLTSPEYAEADNYIITWCVMRALMDMVHTEDGRNCFPQIYHIIIERLPTDYLSWGNIWGLNYPGLMNALWHIFDVPYFETDESFQTLFITHFKASFFVKMAPKISHAA